MKKILVITVLFVAFISCKDDASSRVKAENVKAAAEREAKSGLMPIIKWEKTEHDFGTINQGDKVETVFKFTNVGKGSLVITKARSSCGCTVPTWPTEAVKPGESSEIKVVFNSSGKKNKVTKVVTLTTNTEKGAETVKIKTFVNAPKNPKRNIKSKQRMLDENIKINKN